MSYFPEMEWSTKWEWENLDAYGSKAIESAKKLQLAGWMLVDEGEIEAGSFNLSGGGNNSVASGSDGGNGSSGKSSASASTDSSTKDGMQNQKFSFMGFNGSTLDFSKMKGSEVSETSPPLEASVVSFEPVIGLKLGKRTYFENSGNVKSASLPVMPTPSIATQKKMKPSRKVANIPRCQVEGCSIDLSTFKEYHQKHRVCDTHSKCPKVVIGGHERRFCQQCSRFHSLAEFDEKKRSCRRRLSDHNARRRKPPQETIDFNSSRISSPFYDGRQQLSFLLNNSPVAHSASPASSTWDSSCDSKFTLTKEYPLKSDNNGGTGLLHMSGVQFQHVTNTQGNPANGLFPSKTFRTDVLSPGTKGSLMISSHLEAAPAYRRALSLLSNNSWGSCTPESAPVQSHDKDIYTTQPMINLIPGGVPLSCSNLWQSQHLNPPIQSMATNSNFQEFQLLDMPDFYSNILN